ncbi:peroxidase [candidate division KSB1 bacterium]|nr:peroxidase [candidate division KSB1 bacterium]
MIADYQQAEISTADRAMLDYAVKLTREPAAITQADVDALRHVGFSDAAILDICQVTAYYAFVNRLADGLGVELEDYWNEQQG